jgi:hypothetical protein
MPPMILSHEIHISDHAFILSNACNKTAAARKIKKRRLNLPAYPFAWRVNTTPNMRRSASAPPSIR